MDKLLMTGDAKEWTLYVKGVKPLRKSVLPITTNILPPNSGQTSELCHPVNRYQQSTSCVLAPTLLDKKIEKHIRQGTLEIEARLDLHGMTQQEAYDAFVHFFDIQRKRGRRILLVITGKGSSGKSVLRAQFPRWCEEPCFSKNILALRMAATPHGGQGAWYLILRRTREGL